MAFVTARHGTDTSGFGVGAGDTLGRLHSARGTSFFLLKDILRRLYNLAAQAHVFASSLGTVAGSVPVIVVNESGSGTHIPTPALIGVYLDMEETMDRNTLAFLDP